MRRSVILGGAQFGINYGKHVPVPELQTSEVDEILETGLIMGSREIDLALNYKSADHRLSSSKFSKNYDFSTKIFYSEGNDQQIRRSVKKSMNLLGIGSFKTILVHNWAELNSDARQRAMNLLIELQQQSLCLKIGISVYEPEDLNFSNWIPDIVQAPLNFYNKSFLADSYARQMQANGTIFIARSIFHQGVLLNINSKLLNRYPELLAFQNYCERSQLSVIAGSLSVYDNQDLFSNLVVGVASKSQLIDICQQDFVELSTEKLSPNHNYRSEFTDPRKWATD
jgi:aryl-alcohol dehydrogenase-like predicted oxidoreductase